MPSRWDKRVRDAGERRSLGRGLLGLLDRINISEGLIRVQGDPLALATGLQVHLTPEALISRSYIRKFS
jgi:hypothetical protein